MRGSGQPTEQGKSDITIAMPAQQIAGLGVVTS